MVPTAPDWPVWVRIMLTTHFDLVWGPFWVPRGPKRDRFGPKCPFWGPQRSSEGPEGPDLVPTAANWSDWVGVMVTRHFDLVLGLFRAPRAPKRALLAPKGPVGGPIGSQRAPGDQIWSQLPLIGLSGLDSWSPHTLTWYWAPSGSPRGQKGLFGPDP